MQTGKAAFVLPRYENSQFYHVEKGYYFGLEDMIRKKRLKESQDVQSTFDDEEVTLRCFTVSTIEPCEVLLLNIDEVQKMNIDFPKAFKIFYDN